MLRILSLLLLLLCFSLFGMTSSEIIKKVENNLNGQSAKMQMTMIVDLERNKRTMKMEVYSLGKDKSFIKILYPKKDKGITFLKLDNNMWQYVPKIERIIKIPASMMLQSWMGSDFSNDDLVKESSILDDYNHEIIFEDENIYKIKLIPKEDAAVVWSQVIMSISKKYFLPLESEYYDEDNKKQRVLYYKDIKKIKDRFYPTYWEMIPLSEDKSGHKTTVLVDDVIFDEEIPSSYFTKLALKKYSK